jgi:Aldehyde dehydrogenase family
VGEADINAVVEYATAAFKGEWGSYIGAQRAKIINKFADLIEKHAWELAALDALCMGRPVGPSGAFIVPEVASVFSCKSISPYQTAEVTEFRRLCWMGGQDRRRVHLRRRWNIQVYTAW